jgi:hypothetical protein
MVLSYTKEMNKYFPDWPKPNPEWQSKTFENCVLEGNQECSFIQDENSLQGHRSQIIFFCGQNHECL